MRRILLLAMVLMVSANACRPTIQGDDAEELLSSAQIPAPLLSDAPPAVPPGIFSVLGVAGDVGDATADAWLASGADPVVSFTVSAGAASYDLEITDPAGTTTLCVQSGLAASPAAFSGCGLVNGASYRVKASARSAGGTLTTAVANGPFSFQVDNAAAGAFAISGVTGGSDSTADNLLTSGNDPVIAFAASANASAYDVVVRDGATNLTTICSALGVAASPASPAGCALTGGSAYKVTVTARTVSGFHVGTASNAAFAFTVDSSAVGSFAITGVTGGSDSAADGFLTSGANPTIAFGAATNATRYDVVVKNAANTSTICSALDVTASPASPSGCALAHGTTYKVTVTGKSTSGAYTTPASNAPFTLVVDNAAPGAFTISGVTGGTDSTADAFLTSGSDPTTAFTSSANATLYDVVVKDAANSTTICSTQSAATSPVSPTGCSLVSGTTYKVTVTAKSASGTFTTAVGPFSFAVDNAAVGAFTTTGVTGGADSTADGYLTSGGDPTIAFATATNAAKYDVFVKNVANTSTVCSAIDVTSSPASPAGCALANGSTYKVTVVGKSASLTYSTTSSSAPFTLVVDNTAPGAFTISGVTGGADSTADAFLTSGADPTIAFTGSTNAAKYDVVVKDAANSTTVCSALNATSSPASPAGCSLANGATYKVTVTAKSVSGTYSTPVGPFSFAVDNSAVGAFATSGVTGGTDSTADGYLTSGTDPTIAFVAATNATKYDVYVKNAANSSTICSALDVTSSPASPSGCSLVNGTTYKITVVGKSASLAYTTTSSSAPFTLVVDNTAPGAFTISGVTGGTDSTADAFLTSGVDPTIAFTSSTDAAKYDVVVRDAANSATICSALNATSSPASPTGCSLVNGTTYKVTVTAKSVSGAYSTPVGPYSFAVDNTAPGAFTISGVTGGTDSTADALLTNGTDLTVAFTSATNATKYDVVVKDNANATTICSASNATSSPASPSGCALSNAVFYKVTVTAKSASGTYSTTVGPFSFQVDNAVPAAFAITGVDDGAGDTTVDGYLTSAAGNLTIHWNASTDATSYSVSVKDAADSAVLCGPATSATTSKQLTGCNTDNTSYHVHVSAISVASAWTTPASNDGLLYVSDRSAPSTPVITAPAATTYLSATLATFTWNASTDPAGGSGMKEYTIELFAQTACGGTVQGSSTLPGTSKAFSGLSSGNIYSARVIARDNAGNVSSAACSPDVVVDTVAPSAVAFTTPAAAITVGVAPYTYQWNAAADTGGSGMGTYFVELFRNGTCAGSPATTLTQSGLSYSDTLLSGLNSLRVSPKDRALNTGSAQCSAAVSFNTIAAGDTHSCALYNGKVFCWGYNSYGQVGDNTTTNRAGAVEVSGITNATSLALGNQHSCAVLATGSMKCWGYNINKQLGDNTTTSSSVPVAVTGITGAVAAAAGNYHTCALLSSGAIKCWGSSSAGVLGNNGAAFTGAPVSVSGVATAVAISAGYNHSCAVLADGTVRCWGGNTYGSIGDNTSGTDRLVPTQASGITTATGVSTHEMHSCALLSDGTARCWGQNGSGQLGDNTFTQRLVPVTVTGLAGAVSIVVGRQHSCSLLSTGGVKCWGKHDMGQVGDGSNVGVSGGVSKLIPTAVSGLSNAVSVDLGEYHSCALLSDGTARCWGYNSYGQAGVGSGLVSFSPQLVPSITGAVSVGAGYGFTCVALLDGSVKCWGANVSGSLGDGTANDRITPPAAVSGITNAVNVFASGFEINHYGTACATMSDGTARCWGEGGSGQLGNNASADSNVPVVVSGMTNAQSISPAGGGFHSCALLQNGAVQCWGSNTYNQLGDGSTTPQSVPLTIMPAGSARSVATGTYGACAVLTDGTARCWGLNLYGQAGDGTNVQKTYPTAVSGLANARAVSMGDEHSCALLADGTAKCWGSGFRLGDGTANLSYTPVSVSGLSGADLIVSSGDHSWARLADGGLKAWGLNNFGELGDGSNTNRNAPVALSGLSNVLSVSGSGRHACAVEASGLVKCWGNDAYGTGIANFFTSPQPVSDYPSDTAAPAILWDGIPFAATTNGTASFTFHASEAATGYQCQIDGGGYSPCAGSASYPGLTAGAHTFDVYATDAAGNGSPATKTSYTWTVGTITLASSPNANPVDFGSAAYYGSSADTVLQDFTISNTGNIAGVGFKASLSTGTSFRVAGGTCFSRATLAGSGAATCTVSVSFKPASAGVLSDALTVTTTNGGTVSVNVQGTGVAAALLSWSDSPSYSFGRQAVGSSTTKSLTLSNTGVAAASSLGVTILGFGFTFAGGYPGSGGDCGTSLGNGSSCAVVVTFAPTAAESHAGSINASYNNGLSTKTLRRHVHGHTAQVVAGGYHTCGLLADGTAKCWGYNTNGAIGDNSSLDRSTPVAVTGLSSLVSVDVGDYHSCALSSTGAATCWGYNQYGRIGDNTTTSRLLPTAVTGISNVSWISAGGSHTCAALSDGTAKCWGYGSNGQIGDGVTTTRNMPAPVSGLSGALMVEAGALHTCALIDDGTVRCWGDNSNGQLGDNSNTQRKTPVAVSGISSAVRIGVGHDHGCALLADGTAKCWGANSNGQLGDGSVVSRLVPVSVSGGLSNFVSIAGGYTSTCALLSDWTGRCWGSNSLGELGTGTSGTVSNVPAVVSGLAGAVGISAGDDHGCAQLFDGTARCWGSYSNGRVGNRLSSNSSFGPTRALPNRTVAIAGGADNASVGADHFCAVNGDGTMSCWGHNGFGQLGDGTTDPGTGPVAVTGLAGAVSAVGGTRHSCALLSGGGVKCWGGNNLGQIGVNVVGGSYPSPTAVTGITTAVGLGGGNTHTCALLSNGTVKCWGYASNGQLGDNLTGGGQNPVQVSGISNAISLGASWLSSCAVLVDGTVKCWGYNSNGQLGDNSTTQRNVPVSVSGITNAVSVAGGQYHTCAVLQTGAVKCWGQNSSGQLGDNTSGTNRLVPVDVSGITNAASLALGELYSCAVLQDATAKCWGYNALGQLGDNTGTGRLVPVAVSGLTGVFGIAAAKSATCAFSLDGLTSCWGHMMYGNLGTGLNPKVPSKVVDYPSDVFAPTVTLDTLPAVAGITTTNSASFVWHADEAASSYLCSLDGGSYASCDGGFVSYSSLSTGAHTLNVYGIDPLNNGGPADSTLFSWVYGLATLAASPASPFAYGSVSSSSYADQVFTITNTGDVAATIPRAALTTGAQFRVVGGSCVSRGRIEGGGTDSCTYRVRFTPGTTGSFTDTVSFSSVNGAGVSVSVSGDGI